MATAVAPPWLRLSDGGILAAVLALTCQTGLNTIDSAGLAVALAFAFVFVLTSSSYSLQAHTIGLGMPVCVLAVTWLLTGQLVLSPRPAFDSLTQAPMKFLGGTCCMTAYQVRSRWR
jgi:hypothetical protein